MLNMPFSLIVSARSESQTDIPVCSAMTAALRAVICVKFIFTQRLKSTIFLIVIRASCFERIFFSEATEKNSERFWEDTANFCFPSQQVRRSSFARLYFSPAD